MKGFVSHRPTGNHVFYQSLGYSYEMSDERRVIYPLACSHALVLETWRQSAHNTSHIRSHHTLPLSSTFVLCTYSAKCPYVLKINKSIKEAHYLTKALVFTHSAEITKHRLPVVQLYFMYFTWWHTYKIPLLAEQQDFSVLVDWFLQISTHRDIVGVFTLITSIRDQLTPTERLPSLIHRLRLFERQKGGHPVYRDHREERDWLRGDSLITCASAIGRRGSGGGGSSCIIQEKPGGEWRRTLGAKRHMQTMPRVSEIQISLVDLSPTAPGFQQSSYGLTVKLKHLC